MSDIINEYNNIITFIQEIERLKDITRTAWTKKGKRESVAEHSWRLAVFALVLDKHFSDLDMNRVIMMCLIHDLGEAYEGDVSAKLKVDQEKKLRKEEKALQNLLAPLPEITRNKLLELWWEYNNGETKEAKLKKAIDKMETIIQHNQGNNPSDFDYRFNLEYGKKYSTHDPVIKALRDIIDTETLKRASTRYWE
jgi:putative hydrolase of HD superfamily